MNSTKKPQKKGVKPESSKLGPLTQEEQRRLAYEPVASTRTIVKSHDMWELESLRYKGRF